MPEILFREYRDYVANRVEVNNAMMALLAGSRLAAHTLQLHAGSTATLAHLFPAVEHIRRFDLRSDSARDLLHDADKHIASVSIPYALATHEEFVIEMIDFLKREGATLATHGKQVKAWNMHTVLFETCGYPAPVDWMESFHVLREARNCIIHAGGTASPDLKTLIGDMGTGSQLGWAHLNLGHFPRALVDGDGRLALTAEHVFTAFAVTKGIGRAINAALGAHLGVRTWARVAVEDFAASTSKPRNSSGWQRGARGFARKLYAEASVSDADVERAARDLGLWTALEAWAQPKKKVK